MENMQNSTIPTPKPVRPTFLTVLCILTFIGSGLGIINGITDYMGADITSEFAKEALDVAKEEVKEEASSDKGAELAEKVISGASKFVDPEKMRNFSLFRILSNVMTLFGGILMFRLRKMGFWIYLIGTVVLISAPIAIFGGGDFVSNLLSLGASVALGFFGLLFVVMYAVNLKHMK